MLLGHISMLSQAQDSNYTLIMCADTPLITTEILNELKATIVKGYDAVCASLKKQILQVTGELFIIKGFQIVEEKDATDEQRVITEVNSGLYIFKTKTFYDHIYKLDTNNKSGEFI